MQEVADPVVILEEGLRGSEAELQSKRRPMASCTVSERFTPYLRLSQLVVVMGESQVKPPAVDVHGLSQDGPRHGGTLDVPPGPPLERRSQEGSGSVSSRLARWAALRRDLTFPHGESHDGSPGLDAFHRAKSLGDFFSLNLSAEMLRSPAGENEGVHVGNDSDGDCGAP